MAVAHKLRILADGAKYDASCASSGAVRSGTPGGLGNSDGTGICHSYTPDGRCVSLLKILLTNYCIYDCQYCVNRVSSDVPCATLVACLRDIRDWSRANPTHVPVMILVEAKDGRPDDPDGIGFVEPIAFDVETLRALDEEIRSVFGDDHVITPDRVRRGRATLEEAIRTTGWPLLRDARGKVLFALDNTGEHRARYLQGSPSLEGRVMFVSSPPGEPSAAFLKMNEALGDEDARIQQMVEAGYLVRTRADIPTAEARTGDTTRRDSAFRSGAHYVSTDYPEVSPFGSGYIARLPGAERLPARCNPVTAPPGCRPEWLERNAEIRR